MTISIGEGVTVAKMLLDADQYRDELADVAKEIRKHNKEEREAALVLKAVQKEQDRLTAATNKNTAATRTNTTATSSNTTSANANSGAKRGQAAASGMASKAMSMAKGAAVGLAVGGIAVLTRSLVENIKESDKFVQAQKVYKGSIEGARAATSGLISDYDLMIAKNRLVTLGVDITDERFNSMLGHVRRLSQVMGIDMSLALEKTTFGLSRQSQKLIDDIGVVMNATKAQELYAERLGVTTGELTEQQKAAAFATEALAQMQKKAVAVGEDVSTAGQEIKKLQVTIGNAASAAFASISQWKPLISVIQSIGTAARQAVRDMKMIHKGAVETPELRAEMGRRMNEARRRIKSYGVDPDAPVMPTGIPTVTRRSIEKQIAIMRDYQKRLNALTMQGIMERRRAALLAGKVGEAPIAPVAPGKPRTVRDRNVTQPRRSTRIRSDAELLAESKWKMEIDLRRQAMADEVRLSDQKWGRQKVEADKEKALIIDLADYREQIASKQREDQERFAAERELQRVREFEKFRGKMERSEGVSLVERILPEDQYVKFIERLQGMDEVWRTFSTGMLDGAAGAFQAFGRGMWEAIKGTKSLGDALQASFHAFLSTWGQKMALQALEYAAVSIGFLAVQNYPGAAQAAAAAAAFGLAAAAAGVGAHFTAPAKSTSAAKTSSTDRGLGGATASTPRSSAQATFIYNINTITANPDEAAEFTANSIYRAQNLGYLPMGNAA